MEVVKIESSHLEKSYNQHIDNKTNLYYDIFIRNDIAKFTYYDYLYIEKQKTKECCMIRETLAKYEAISSNTIHNEHDKTYRKILDNKDYAIHIINEALNLTKPIKGKEIEKYTNRYITEGYLDKETDVVYKMKNKEIYFLIEHQSSIDYSMSFRLEEYKLEIMKSAIDKRKIKTKGYKIPIVIPIVIYTGKEKWTVGKKLNQVLDERLEELNLLQYNLIDINTYTKEKLLKSDNFVDKVFLIEKTKNEEELTSILQTIVKQVTKEEDKNNLINIIKVMLKEKIGEEKLEEIIKEMKGEGEDMLACVEMIREENKRIRAEGRAEGIKEAKRIIINNMKKEGMSVKEMKGEGKDMLACVEMIREENKRIRKEGRKEGIKEGKKQGIKEGIMKEKLKIVAEMKKNNIDIELIEKIVGIKIDEIEENNVVE